MQVPIEFVEWYSGMQREKILNAFQRWQKEATTVGQRSMGTVAEGQEVEAPNAFDYIRFMNEQYGKDADKMSGASS